MTNVEQQNFYIARHQLASKVRYEIAEVYELPSRQLQPFDFTLFLGVLYHLRHPLRALEIVCGLTRQIAIVDSFIVDDDYRGSGGSPIPWTEFYETTELSNQIDNWVGPTLPCLMALCRSAGFARVEVLNVKHRHARIACYRNWEPEPEQPGAEPPVLNAAVNGRWGDNGINFYTAKEEFVTLWFSSQQQQLRREDIRAEVSGYGVPALALQRDGEHDWHANIYLPPGLTAGWHDVRLRTAHSRFSQPRAIAVDMPVVTNGIQILSVCDGRTWSTREVVLNSGENWGYLTLHVAGAAQNCDRNNVRVFCDMRRLPVEYVSAPDRSGISQINMRIPADLAGSLCEVSVEHGGHRANAPVMPIKLMSKASVSAST